MTILRKKRDFTIPKSGIDSIEKVTIGDVEQTILIQAVDPKNPILLFIHGGPCMPVPGVVSRGQDYAIAISTKELVKNFVLVFWDQRGAGKSYHPTIPVKTIRLEQFIQDCHELIDRLRERFQQEKLFLAGHSWGTIIGLSIATRYPEKLHAYFGISQIMNWTENDAFCYHWVKLKATAANVKKTLKKLEELGMPPYTRSVKQWIEFRTPLTKYKSMPYDRENKKGSDLFEVFKLFLNSPEYSLVDIFHTFYSAYKRTYTQKLIEDFAQIDFHSIKKLEVPVYFFHGTQDMHLDGKPVQKFIEQLEAPYGKEIVWYDHSSHMFHPDDAHKIETSIIQEAESILT